MRGAVDLERGVLRGGDHVAHGDALRIAGEMIPAVRAAGALHDLGTPQLEHDLLDVVGGQPLARGDLAPRHRPLVHATGQVKGTDESVFGLSGDSHVSNVTDAGQP